MKNKKVEKIKVLLSDTQVLFREGMHFTLSAEDDLEVIGETTNNTEALAFIGVDTPNIAVLGIRNGSLDGPAATRRIRRNFPSVSVILMADRDEEELLFAAIKCGAAGYLTKDISPEYLLDTLRVVVQGSQPLIDSLLIAPIASRTLKDFEESAALSEQFSGVMARLSSRENEILNSIAAGSDIERMASDLNYNEETIRKNLRSVMNKLIANDQARDVISAAQGLPAAAIGADSTANFVTRQEFNEFKEALIKRFTSLIGES